MLFRSLRFGGTREELLRLAADAPTFSPKDDGTATLQPSGAVDDPAAEIARLAKLSPIQCDRELPAAAERLGCRVPTLRAAVAAARGNGAAIPGQGRPLDLPEPEPWPQPVDGTALLEEMVTTIRQYIVFTEAQAVATALWAIFTHAFDAFDFSPRLTITSAEKRSGKTGSSRYWSASLTSRCLSPGSPRRRCCVSSSNARRACFSTKSTR